MLVGIQWSGKGTQARKILEKYPDFILFEMGTELRAFAKLETEDGKRVRTALEAWLKAPTEYIVKLTEKFLSEHKDKKVLIDGAIRSAEQNDALESVWWDFDILWLDLDEETAVKRLSGRRIDPITSETFPASFAGDNNPKTGNKLVTRADDTPEAIRKRIAWSIGETLPLIEVWKRHDHEVFHIDAGQAEDEIFSQVEKMLQKNA
jgi:adenylate kinase